MVAPVYGIVRWCPTATIMARSTTLRSSRMFPGQEYRCSASMLSRGIASMRLPNDFENSSTKRHTSKRDVLGPLAQGRHLDREDVETVVQVLPEGVRR